MSYHFNPTVILTGEQENKIGMELSGHQTTDKSGSLINPSIFGKDWIPYHPFVMQFHPS